MTYTKKDGSLDIERINKLPYEEYMEEMGNLTNEQIEEYIANAPLNESNTPVESIIVDYDLDDKRSGVDAEALLIKMKKKYERKIVHTKEKRV